MQPASTPQVISLYLLRYPLYLVAGHLSELFDIATPVGTEMTGALASWDTGIRELMRGMATLPQGNQELLVVKDKVGRPGTSPRNLIFSLQCFDTVSWATGKASGL